MGIEAQEDSGDRRLPRWFKESDTTTEEGLEAAAIRRPDNANLRMNIFLRNLAEDFGGMFLLGSVIGRGSEVVLTQNIRAMSAGYHSLRTALLDQHSGDRAAAISRALAEFERLRNTRLETQYHIRTMTKLMSANHQALLEITQKGRASLKRGLLPLV